MIDRMSQTQLVDVLFIYKAVVFKDDYMFRPSSLGHHHVVNPNRGSHKIWSNMWILWNLISVFWVKL